MISGETKVVGLIGNPVEHSVSSSFQNAAFEKSNLDYVYVPFKVTEDSIPEAVKGIKSLGLIGVNVTIPHKSKVMNYLDEVDELAEKIGAVNTIKNENNSLKGFNTDGIGALKALEEKKESVREKNVLLLGAGGAARSIAFTLVQEGANLEICNRTASKAKNLASEIKNKTGAEVKQVPQEKEKMSKTLEKSDVLINSTSVGMHPNTEKTLVNSDEMQSDLTVMDIVYNPLKTKLLQEAEKAGAKTVEGLGMLVHQGAESFKIWTGEKPPIKTMRKTAKKAMEKKQ